MRLRQVEVRRLDDCIPAGVPVAFIKLETGRDLRNRTSPRPSQLGEGIAASLVVASAGLVLASPAPS